MLLSISSESQDIEIGWFSYLSSFVERLWGLLGGDAQSPGVLIDSCRSIHSYGMKMAIDVAFVDEHMRCLRVVKKLLPNKTLSCPHARFVLERPASSQEWFVEHDCIRLAVLDIASCREALSNIPGKTLSPEAFVPKSVRQRYPRKNIPAQNR